MNYRGLRQIISGGQDGVDRGALQAAKYLSVKTGGTAPKGFRTARGTDHTLQRYFGLVEHTSADYPPRTELNVVNSDGTLIIASVLSSPGTKLTLKFIKKHKKPFYIVQIPAKEQDFYGWELRDAAHAVSEWLISDAIEVLNVAGNHKKPEYHHDATVQIVRGVIEDLSKQGLVVYDL